MREIKFRAWDKEYKKFLYNNAHISLDLHGNVYNLQNGEGNSVYELTQFTGLKDKNGVDIYEGDIVRFNGFYEGDYYRKDNGVAYIICDEEGFAVVQKEKNGAEEYLCSVFDLAKNYGGRVIGNIYENPELL